MTGWCGYRWLVPSGTQTKLKVHLKPRPWACRTGTHVDTMVTIVACFDGEMAQQVLSHEDGVGTTGVIRGKAGYLVLTTVLSVPLRVYTRLPTTCVL